jgi:UDP-2-acetamido-3-amino-2,3-dideoxy-glucuronate N-acetyltransferase
MVGVPSKHIGWMSRFGERLDLPLKGNAETICPKTNEKYILVDGKCSIVG